MAKNKEPLDLDNIDFFELLAHTANDTKQTLVIQLTELAGKGDPAALKILERALLNKTEKDENKPIPILAGITQEAKLKLQQNAVPSNDSTI